MLRFSILLLLIASLCLPTTQGSAQVKVEVSELKITYKFNDQITTQFSVSAISSVQELFLNVRPQGQETILDPIPLTGQGEITHTLNLKQHPIRPFSRVETWVTLQTTNAERMESAKKEFFYEDNLQSWQRLEDGQFIVSWRAGDQIFGQALLNAARSGLRSVSNYIPTALPSITRIYVYPNARDMQNALLLNQQSWVAGHTNPDLGVMLLSIAPGLDQQLEMDRQIPHELAHIALHQLTGPAGYLRLPIWLSEGVASLTEINPNSEYRIALEQNSKTGQVIPLENLCLSFPTDAPSAFLAYAQSASFVRFYFQKFGATGLTHLIDQYKNGLGCQEGVQAASGTPLPALQSTWKQESLGINPTTIAIKNLAPYLVLAAILFIVPLSLVLSRRTRS